MDMDRMDELASDPCFISGIYNYYDRWCERCAFTSRCLNYAMGEEMEASASLARDSENEAFSDKLHETSESTKDMIEEETEDLDFDLDEEELQESIREHEEIRDAAQAQPCSRTAWRYIEVVDQWFQAHEELFANKGGALEFLTRTDQPGAGPVDDVTPLRDCLEVIRWYQRQIYVKLCRAAPGMIRGELEDNEFDHEDANGSAKVALMGIERPLAAWATLRRRFPAHEDAIFALGTLRRLLRQVEAAFPHARAFLRPGFDPPSDSD